MSTENQKLLVTNNLSYLALKLTAFFFIAFGIFVNLVPLAGGWPKEVFFNTYWIVILPGLLLSTSAVRAWGGMKSILGRSLLFAAFGLSAQLFGQISFSILHLMGKEQYPSIADVGYFGSIFLYFLAAYNIAHAAGAKVAIRSFATYIQVLIIPLIVLYFTIIMFVKDLSFDNSNLVKSLLDFGYPIGQSIYLIMAILALTLSKNYLGGLMRSAVMMLCAGLFVQYFADAIFLYRTANGTWAPGGLSDMLYLSAYFLMGSTMNAFYSAYSKLYSGAKSK